MDKCSHPKPTMLLLRSPRPFNDGTPRTRGPYLYGSECLKCGKTGVFDMGLRVKHLSTGLYDTGACRESLETSPVESFSDAIRG